MSTVNSGLLVFQPALASYMTWSSKDTLCAPLLNCLNGVYSIYMRVGLTPVPTRLIVVRIPSKRSDHQ